MPHLSGTPPALPPAMPQMHDDDLAHLGAEVLAAVLRHRGPSDEDPAVIAAWIDERLERAALVDTRARAIEVVDVCGWQPWAGEAK